MQKKEITNQFQKKLYEQTRKRYIEENKFALFNVVSKEKNEMSITAIRTSIGYILPNNTIYDFVSKHVYVIYELNKRENMEREGEFATVHNVFFRESNKRFRANDKNLQKLESSLEKYIQEYKNGESKVKDYTKRSDEKQYILKAPKKLI